MRRSRTDRFAGGVSAPIAQRFCIDPTIVRVLFVLGALAGGYGLAIYAAAWLFIPLEGEETRIAARAAGDRRGITICLAIASALAVVLVLSSALKAGWLGSFAWPLFGGAAGLVLILRNQSDEERALFQESTATLAGLGLVAGRSPRAIVARSIVGAGLLAGGLLILILGHTKAAVLEPIGGVLLVIGGFVVVLAPWWLRIARDLGEERRARARAEERADMAARVHDSVLQTLALIQRRAEEPQDVRRLARAQERELREWLFDGRPPGRVGEDAPSLAAALQQVVREVEEAHGVEVESVTVGDCLLDEDLRELVAAGREATVNAAKWSGAPSVSLFAEVEPDAVSVFVRDRGRGFDPASVAEDRRGIAESIRGRVSRRGGVASIRSSLGEGTEVSLVMPRKQGAHGGRRQ
jgi:signal transduction histidine kinase